MSPTVPKWLTALPVSAVALVTTSLRLANPHYFGAYYQHVGATTAAVILSLIFILLATLPFLAMNSKPVVSLRNAGLSLLVVSGTLLACTIVILSPAVISLIHELS